MNSKRCLLLGMITALIFPANALAGHGLSSNSAPSAAFVRGTPEAPADLRAGELSHVYVTLSWSDRSGNETLFRIERRTGTDGTWGEIGTAGANVTVCHDWSTVPQTLYTFRIRACNAEGCSGYSNEARITTGQWPIPPIPHGLRARAPDLSRIRLEWYGDSSWEDGFRLERKPAVAGTWKEVAVVASNIMFYEDNGVAPDTAYVYRVRAYADESGASNPGNEAWADTFGDPYDAVIPAAAHTAGANGTEWRSDLDLLNTGPSDATVTLSLLLANQANPAPPAATVTVPPGRCLRLPDVLGTVFQAGNAALGLRFGGGSVRAGSRFYNAATQCGGTFGMSVPASDRSRALPGDGASRATFHLLSHDPSGASGFRANIGFASVSGFPVVVRIRLYDGTGGKLAEMTQPLEPFEHRQITRIHEYLHTPAVAAGSAVVEVLTNGGRVHAYAMLIDNVSGDPVYLTPDIVTGSTGLASAAAANVGQAGNPEPASVEPDAGTLDAGQEEFDLYIPAAAHTPGVNGTLWRTDLDLLNPDSSPARVKVALLAADQDNSQPAAVTVTIAPGDVVRLPDVLGQVFFASNAALGLRFETGRVLACARFYNSNSPCTRGTHGMLVPAVDWLSAAAPERPAVFHHLSYDPSGTAGSRTNLGFVNARAFPVTVRITLYGDAGQAVGVATHTLLPREHRQFTRIHEHLQTPAVAAGWAAVEVLTAGGAVHPYAMVIDNVSGDPVYLSARAGLAAAISAGELLESGPAGDLRFVPAGFCIEDSPGGEPCRNTGLQFRFTRTRPLAVMEGELSRSMWAGLKAAQPSLPADPSDRVVSASPDCPVQNVTWFEAVLFANLLSREEGLDPCYFKDEAFTVPVDAGNYSALPVYCDFSACGYRLPSDSEREYFCRAGTTGPFSLDEPAYGFGNCNSFQCAGTTGLPSLDTVAWWYCNAGSIARPAGGKAANPWNLLDVHGNVAEWCWDPWSGDRPPYGADVNDYVQPGQSDTRVVRGGSADELAFRSRSAFRVARLATLRDRFTGFRLVRTLRW